MIVEDAVKVEGCLEGSNVYDIKLLTEIDRSLVEHLGKIGKLIYRENYDKPFFRIIVRGKYSIKGVLESNEIRVILPDNADFSSINEIIDHIKDY